MVSGITSHSGLPTVSTVAKGLNHPHVMLNLTHLRQDLQQKGLGTRLEWHVKANMHIFHRRFWSYGNAIQTLNPTLAAHEESLASNCSGISIPTGVWTSLAASGTRPPPCTALSLTSIDSKRVVFFGGRQADGRVNDLYILDLEAMVSILYIFKYNFILDIPIRTLLAGFKCFNVGVQ